MSGDDLITWFREQLDQDEAATRTTLSIVSHIGKDYEAEWRWVMLSKPNLPRAGWSSTFHPGAPSPAAVLADIAAKRAVLDYVVEMESYIAAGNGQCPPFEVEGEVVVKLLAQAYAGRPGFDPAWRTM